MAKKKIQIDNNSEDAPSLATASNDTMFYSADASWINNALTDIYDRKVINKTATVAKANIRFAPPKPMVDTDEERLGDLATQIYQDTNNNEEYKSDYHDINGKINSFDLKARSLNQEDLIKLLCVITPGRLNEVCAYRRNIAPIELNNSLVNKTDNIIHDLNVMGYVAGNLTTEEYVKLQTDIVAFLERLYKESFKNQVLYYLHISYKEDFDDLIDICKTKGIRFDKDIHTVLHNKSLKEYRTQGIYISLLYCSISNKIYVSNIGQLLRNSSFEKGFMSFKKMVLSTLPNIKILPIENESNSIRETVNINGKEYSKDIIESILECPLNEFLNNIQIEEFLTVDCC